MVYIWVHLCIFTRLRHTLWRLNGDNRIRGLFWTGLLTSMVPMWVGAEPRTHPFNLQFCRWEAFEESSTVSKDINEDEPESTTVTLLKNLNPPQKNCFSNRSKSIDIPIVINESSSIVDHFSNSGRWTASRWIRASEKYRNLIRNEFKKANLPQDLLYMAMIEMALTPEKSCRCSWHLAPIPETGAEYGLIINDVIDERRDPIRSTQAAIAYLSKLNKEFGGNWHLAMASYNAGERRIYKAVSEKGTINYWELRDALAEETQFYVPKILALAILDNLDFLVSLKRPRRQTH